MNTLLDLLTEARGSELVGIPKGNLSGTGEENAPLSEAMEAANGFMKGVPVASNKLGN